MTKGRIRKFFPGGNTSEGFFSYYSYILDQKRAKRIIVIKGGPGVGKSTFIKKMAYEMLNLGYDVEFLYCSSDNESLDGVVIPAIKVALIDGTTPHIVDPKNPGAVDEIIHLGDFWDEDGIRKHREEIIEVSKQIGNIFARAYRYLRAAACFYEDNEKIYSEIVDRAKVNKICASVVNELFGKLSISQKEGNRRCMFASAITPKGVKHYLDTILTGERIYAVKGAQGTGTERLLEKVAESAVERGFDVEAFYCAFKPGKLEHLVIPEMEVSFTTSNVYHNAATKKYREIDLDMCLNTEAEAYYADIIDYNNKMFGDLLLKAVSTISDANLKRVVPKKFLF
jgi:hypothetical protein